MSKFTTNDLRFIMDRKFFPNCIECSEHYLDEELKDFFHTRNCTHGRETDWDVISKRLDERLEAFNKRHGEHGSEIECEEPTCTKRAVGMMHVLFHNTKTTAEKWAVCMDHAYHTDTSGRECQFKMFKK